MHHLGPESTRLLNLLAFDPAVDDLGCVVAVASEVLMGRSERLLISSDGLGRVGRLLGEIATIRISGNTVGPGGGIDIGEVAPVLRVFVGRGVHVGHVLLML